MQDQNSDAATVKADLEYHRKDGSVTTVNGLLFHLVTQPGSKLFKHDWLIDKVTVGP